MGPIHVPRMHSFEFTLSRVLLKIFVALPKDTYRDICKYFGADPIEELISVRQSKYLSQGIVRQKATYMYVGRFLNYDNRV